ncbi:hypothetical protein U1Q18_012391, partial [Sarracenia purpurea var. burkii]
MDVNPHQLFTVLAADELLIFTTSVRYLATQDCNLDNAPIHHLEAMGFSGLGYSHVDDSSTAIIASQHRDILARQLAQS